VVCLGIYAVQLLLGYDNYGLVCLAAQSVTQKLQGDCRKHTSITYHVTSSTHLPIPMLHIKRNICLLEQLTVMRQKTLPVNPTLLASKNLGCIFISDHTTSYHIISYHNIQYYIIPHRDCKKHLHAATDKSVPISIGAPSACCVSARQRLLHAL